MPTSVIIAAVASYAGAAIAATSIASVAVFAAGGWLTLGMISTAATVLVGGVLRSALSSGQGGSSSSAGFTAAAQGRDQVVRSSVANRTVVYGRAMVSGPLVFAAASGSGNGVLHLVIPVAGHAVDGIEDVYFNDVLVGALDGSGNVTSGPYAGYAQITKHLGTAGDAADAGLIAANVGWTAAHKLSGVAYLVVKLTFNSDVYPTGIPNIKAVIRGKKLYDPRTGLTTWSANPALAVRDYLTSAYGLEAVSAELDDTLTIAAANICDEAITLAGGGTEARYTCNGVVDTGDSPRSIMEGILSSMAGFVVWSGGKYLVYAGAYSAPAVTITADDLRGPVRVRPRISRKDLFNAVRGTYVSPTDFWQPTDFPTVSNATYAVQDGGQVIWRDVAMPYTTSGATAQRIAKIMLERSRQGITVDLSCKLTTFKVATLDTIMLTLPQLGWSAKEFKVLEWKFSPEGGVDMVLQEETASSYNWSSGMETVIDTAPDTALPNPFTIAAPGSPSITESLYQTTGSAGVKSRATVTCAPLEDAFLSGYLFDYKAAGATDWVTLPLERSPTVSITDLAPGSYDFRVRAVNTLQVRSAFSPTVTKEVLGLIAPPASVSNFSVTKVGGVAMGAWDLTGDLDVRIGGRVVIRHSPQTSAATWQDGVILDEFAGDSVSGLLPLISGTYMAKFKDSSGSYSTDMVSFLATEGLVTGFTTVATSAQAPTFAGSKTQTITSGVVLQLDSGALWDDFPGFMDSWPTVDSYGPLYGTGSYNFDNYLDLTSVATRRVEADIKTYSSDAGDLFDTRTALMDDWDDMDGAIINDCDATLYYSATNDDPAASPTWSAWTPFFVADVTCRAIRFRLDLISGDPTHQIAVSTLTVHVKEPV
jgi:hypothetical protein